MSGGGEPCPVIADAGLIASAYARYLSDESSLAGGMPARILLPRSVGELSTAVRDAAGRAGSVTVSGGRTGIVGGAVPRGGEDLVSTGGLVGNPRPRWSDEHGSWMVAVPAGITLDALRAFLVSSELPPGLAYPVDPTEGGATVGGSVATNASGARTLRYGPTRDWVLGMSVVLADGSVVHLERGRAGAAAVPEVLRGLHAPGVRLPATKHAAGYRLTGDPVDLFIGCEGTLGVIAEVDLRLCEVPKGIAGVCAFLPDPAGCPDLVAGLKAGLGPDLLALEYFDARSLRLLSAWRAEAREASGVPALPDTPGGMLYVEMPYDGEAQLEKLADRLTGMLAAHGVDGAATWAAFEPDELAAMRTLRHALPERVNRLVAARAAGVPGLTKLATDLAVPDPALPAMMETYRRVFADAGLEHVIFGHIGNAHLHANLLPSTVEEIGRGRAACLELARAAVALGGSVSGEHGIGKLKKALLAIQYTPAELAELRSVKDRLDPCGVLNPGVLW
ncbi:MAG: FAD-binding oxidoreductase [Spirochaetes bacterium]|nr:FAD-binding oxidoreductase [Spirochaetota bacterium]